MLTDSDIVIKKMVLLISIFLVLIILLNSILAEKLDGRIYVVNMKYDRGNITLSDIFIKYGNYQDRKIQTDDGYNCEVLSIEDDVLYSFKFEIPIKIYVPLDENDTNRSIVYLEEANFTLLIPCFDNGKTIIISDPENKEILSIDISKYNSLLKSGINTTYLFIILVAVTVIIILILLVKKNKKEDRWSKLNNKWK